MKDAWLQLGVDLVRAGRYERGARRVQAPGRARPGRREQLRERGRRALTLDRLDEAPAQRARWRSSKAAHGRHARAHVGVRGAGEDRAWRGTTTRPRAATPHSPQQADPASRCRRSSKAASCTARGASTRRCRTFQDAARRLQGQPFTIPELHFYDGRHAGQPRARADEADGGVPARSCRLFPQNTRARGPASRCSTAPPGGRGGRTREIEELLRAVPTPDGYDMAAKTLVDLRREGRGLEAVRAEAAPAVRRRQADDRQISDMVNEEEHVREPTPHSPSFGRTGPAPPKPAQSRRRPRGRRWRVLAGLASRSWLLAARRAWLACLVLWPVSRPTSRRAAGSERPADHDRHAARRRARRLRRARGHAEPRPPRRARRRASTSRTRTPSSRCRRTRASSPASTRSSTASATTPASACPPSTPTLATLLRTQGFATGAFIGSFALDSRFGLERRLRRLRRALRQVERQRRGSSCPSAAPTPWWRPRRSGSGSRRARGSPGCTSSIRTRRTSRRRRSTASTPIGRTTARWRSPTALSARCSTPRATRPAARRSSSSPATTAKRSATTAR